MQDGNSGMHAMLTILLFNEKAQTKNNSLTLIQTPIEEAMSALKRFVFGKDREVVNLSVVLQLLLYKGGNLNIMRGDSESDGWGVAHTAAEEGSAMFLEWFCSVGGDPNLPSEGKHYTPLMCAARKDQVILLVSLLVCLLVCLFDCLLACLIVCLFV